MKREDIHMVQFALLWEPYGGPQAEQVLVEFGMSLARFRNRVNEILRPRPSDPLLVAREKYECRRRLAREVVNEDDPIPVDRQWAPTLA